MRRKRIAALMAGVDREYQQAFTNGMVHAAKGQDVDLCVFNCQGHPEGVNRNDRCERTIFDLPELSAFDGVVLLMATIPTAECREQITQKLRACPNLPLVTIDTPVENSVTITFDDRTSMREMMAHLLDAHRIRHVALVTGPRESPVAMGRSDTCQQVLAERGICLAQEDIIEGSWVRESGYHAAERLLRRSGPMPQAIVCGNDDMAFGLMEKLTEAGVNVPQDVVITGFDALREALGRGLTTVHRPVYEAGERSVELLVEWMHNGRPEDPPMLPTRIIYGRSCGCPLDGTRATSYVRLLSDERRMVEMSLIQAAYFFGGLAGISDKEDAGERINAFASNWGAQLMYVCVDPALLSTTVAAAGAADYPQEMLLLSGWQDGKAAPQRYFPTSQLLPLLGSPRPSPVALVFSPLYSMEKILGYAVLDVAHTSGYAQYALLTLLSGALMSLSLHTTVQAYASALEERSIHDTLTGLYNRRGFEQAVPAMFEKAMKEGRCFAVVSCDMDGMKHINDRHGHLAGDQAISRMGRALRSLEEAGMLCVHISGDEFLAVGTIEDASKAGGLLDTLRGGISRLNREDPWLCDIDASMGVYAAVPKKEDQLNDYLMYADRRMYAEKNRHHGS